METCNIERCIVYYLKKMLTTPHLYSHSKTDLKPEVLQWDQCTRDNSEARKISSKNEFYIF